MTPQQQKEELSKAYLHAIAARVGCAVATWSQDHGCVDATLSAVGPQGGGFIHDPKLDVQLKCSSRQDIERDQHYVWQLERAHYDRLTALKSVPHLLVLLVLPEIARIGYPIP